MSSDNAEQQDSKKDQTTPNVTLTLPAHEEPKEDTANKKETVKTPKPKTGGGFMHLGPTSDYADED